MINLKEKKSYNSTIIFCGDYYSYPSLENYCKINNDSYSIFGDLLPELQKADIAGVNVEFPITKSVKSIKKVGPNLKGDPITLKPLKDAGFNLAYISNNHTLDYGTEGFNDTLNYLKQSNITPIGVGSNLNDARKIYIKEIKGKKIAFLNFSENEFNVATDKSPGANPLDIINNVKDIRQAKKNADFVFVIVHAGQDFNHYPPPFMVNLFRFYAEEGASAIICHHSHYIAGYEVFKNVPIFYGLGNIIYPNKYEEERQKTLVVKFEIANDILSHEVIPFYFDPDEMRLVRAEKGGKYDYFDQIEDLNSTVIDDELNRKQWLTHLKKQEYYRYLVLIGGYPQIIFKIFKKLRLLKYLDKFLSVKNSRYYNMWNLIRRETHRDAILNIFEDKFNKKL